ncbi:hypothetical protein SAMN05216236_12719 [Sedimentitalea nanhaiensis]|uniref:Transposase DDE domain-containing protein n=1 Tax=Sedimentitalea nanhaiensis TaxID=999627 RepID=A0A1I7DF48_9RHOB|nr:hypothetical protein SAMN05216236_12719 [Sedimentitalea nanhaiensis]
MIRDPASTAYSDPVIHTCLAMKALSGSGQHRDKSRGEDEWTAGKHGGPKRRVWRKIHLGTDERTLEVRAFEIRGDHTGDAPVLADLPRQTPAGKEIAPSPLTVPVTYASATMQLPTGVRMPLSRPQNANPFKAITAGEMARNEALRSTKYLGRAHWRNWSGYHRQSRVETKMRCMKLLGQRLMAGGSKRGFSTNDRTAHPSSSGFHGYSHG